MKTSLLLAMALAASLSLAPFAAAQTISPNFGSLGAIADGTTTADAILEVPSPLAAPGDFAIGYAGGARTTIPYLPTAIASYFAAKLSRMRSSTSVERQAR